MKDTFKNVHSHIFTMDNAPENFLRLFLPGFVADIVESSTNTSAGAALTSKLIRIFGQQGRRYAQFLKIGKSRDQLTVFEDMLDQYADTSTEIVALTLNMNYIGAGDPLSGFDGQVQQVIDIKKQYPDRLLIFLGIDPRWKRDGKELQETVKRYFDTKIEAGGKKVYPFVGLKIYPSTGYFVFDERLKETFSWAADNGVPVMAHTYYLGGIFNYNKHNIISYFNTFKSFAKNNPTDPKFIEKSNFGRWLLGSQTTRNCKYSCSYFLDPKTYECVFSHFKENNQKLKICLAHFGGVKQMFASIKHGSIEENQKSPYGFSPHENWFEVIRRLVQTYDGAYTDISYAVAEGVSDKKKYAVFNLIKDELKQPYGDKLLFGTDFFMAEQESSEKTTCEEFKVFASKETDSAGNNLWDKVARDNTYKYLQSNYYP